MPHHAALLAHFQSDRACPSLALSGVNGYAIQGDRVVVTASEVSNNRSADNLSGTLSIELWALKAPYAGGDFSGMALAGTEIGRVSGQHFLSEVRHELPLRAPGEGCWFLTLMLREWEGSGFVTRDHVDFAQPYVVEKAAAWVAEGSTLGVAVDAAATVPGQSADVLAVASGGMDNPSDTEAPRGAAAEGPASTGTEPAPVSPPVDTPTRQPGGKAMAADGRVNLNAATAAELAAIKGLSKKLAQAIVAARPIASVEALLEVKGMGPKLLDKLRPFFRL